MLPAPDVCGGPRSGLQAEFSFDLEWLLCRAYVAILAL